jgi:hypothetical protein
MSLQTAAMALVLVAGGGQALALQRVGQGVQAPAPQDSGSGGPALAQPGPGSADQAPALRFETAPGGRAPGFEAESSLAAPTDPLSALEAANARYLQGDYAGAVRGYEDLVRAGFAGAALFYNLGNAYFRSNRIGWAVLSYERALRLEPGDADSRANLELARGSGVDRLVGAGDEPFLDRLVSRLPRPEITLVFSAAWLALWGLLLARRRVFGRARAWLGVAVLAAALFATASGALMALQARAERSPEAVVVSPVSLVREAPGAALKPTFELHEGTKVRILEASDQFLRVRLPNGLEGWLARDDVAMI